MQADDESMISKDNRKRKIRVLLIAPLPPPLGGMSTYILELLNSKVKNVTDMRVVRSDYLGKENYSGYFRLIVNLLNSFIVSILTTLNIMIWRPAIVHIQTNSGAGYFEKCWYALLSRIWLRKVALHVHGGGFRDFYNRLPLIGKKLIIWSSKISNVTVVASPQMLDTWQMIGISSDKIIHINNAITFPPLSIWDKQLVQEPEHDLRMDKITILFLTRIVLAKGILELIDAVKQIHDKFPGVYLRIVGAEFNETAIVKEYLSSSEIKQYIDFIGTVSEERKQEEYLHADIYAFPTHVEDQSYAVMEAMSYGLPCIASAVGGIPSLIENGVNGLLIPPKDSVSLASALEELACHPELRRRLGMAARSTIQAKFTWDRQSQQIVALYKDMLVRTR